MKAINQQVGPLPQKRQRGRPNKHPWDALEIGGSFVVPQPHEAVYKQAWRAERRYRKTFVSEPLAPDMTRVTRIA